MLSETDITSFQELYKNHFGVEISRAEALDKGLRLIRLMEIISKHEAKKQAAKVNPPITTKI